MGRRRSSAGRGPGRDVPTRARGNVSVEVDQPFDGCTRLYRLVGRDERACVLAQQIVQQVTAPRRLSEQMMIVELVQLAPGILEARVVQRGGRVRVDVWSQREGETAEQPLLI